MLAAGPFAHSISRKYDATTLVASWLVSSEPILHRQFSMLNVLMLSSECWALSSWGQLNSDRFLESDMALSWHLQEVALKVQVKVSFAPQVGQLPHPHIGALQTLVPMPKLPGPSLQPTCLARWRV